MTEGYCENLKMTGVLVLLDIFIREIPELNFWVEIVWGSFTAIELKISQPVVL